MIQTEVLNKLMCRKGYQGCRIRPYPFNSHLWLAEVYVPGIRNTRKIWKPLVEEKTQDNYRTFTTPEQAYNALVVWQGSNFS